MTGYGRSREKVGAREVVLELRSVNHRFCDIITRLPRRLQGLEGRFRKLISDRFSRGRLELSVALDGAEDQPRRLAVDRAAVRQYLSLLRELQREFRLKGAIEVGHLVAVRDLILVAEPEADPEDLAKAAERLLMRAMDAVDVMRRREGKSLERDLLRRITLIRRALQRVERRAPEVLRHYEDRIRSRLREATRDGGIDPGRLAQEVALFAERSDITEELTRLKSHLRQFAAMVRSVQSVGRSLDFLLQEMSREVNTISAKANDARISGEVVGIKAEVEKIREQVQNVE